MEKEIKGFISMEHAMEDRDTLLAIVWETPVVDSERIPCVLTFEVTEAMEARWEEKKEEAREREASGSKASKIGANTQVADVIRGVLNRM
jgi:hypothetical protein